MIRADEASVHWIRSNGFVGDHRLEVFMSCTFPPHDQKRYEVYLAPPDDFNPSREDLRRMTRLEGGLYACMTSRAYGSMSGVLERIYRWLGTASDYEPDEGRTWYAYYIPILGAEGEASQEEGFERTVSVECCVPIVLRKRDV